MHVISDGHAKEGAWCKKKRGYFLKFNVYPENDDDDDNNKKKR